MTRLFRLLLLLTAALLLSAGNAQATSPPPVYESQRPAGLPELQTMITAGVEFWGKRGVVISDPVELLVAADVGAAEDGLGTTPFAGSVRARSISARDYGVNRIVLRDDWARAMLREFRGDLAQPYASHVCALLWHELGHIGGLANPEIIDGRWVDGHPATGLMSQQLTVPGDCKVLARQIVSGSPKTHASRKTHRARNRNRHQGSGRASPASSGSAEHGDVERLSVPDGALLR